MTHDVERLGDEDVPVLPAASHRWGDWHTLSKAVALYTALAGQDVRGLRGMLADEFVGDLTPGLPHGLGAETLRGRDSMIRDGWGRVFELFEIRPAVAEFVATPDRLVARGRYVGFARGTERPLDARFVHVWSIADGRFTGIVQATDSAAWHEALNRG